MYNLPGIDQMPELLTRGETARLLKVTPQTLRAWQEHGHGPRPIALSPKVVRYRRDDVAAFLTAAPQVLA